ncbi:hypothetical protein [Paenibacillus sp. DYY-L-2]|uniref:hypothetical protein n=1 Tax=Paenibacillus sp. DYY-L-2 TaxID=3447013 RepID=UPI003F505571
MTEKVKIVTLGYEKNLVDSEIMSGFMDASGKLKALIVSGCHTQRYNQALMEEMPEIDGIVGTGDFYNITQIVDEALKGKKPIQVGNPVFNYEENLPRKTNYGTDLYERMRRPEQNRDRIPGVSLSTSLIVGSPGETEEDFQHLCDFVREVKFDRSGVFTYSKEEDTPASLLPDRIDEETKARRANALMEIQRSAANDKSGKYLGQELDILPGRYDGRSDVPIGCSQLDAPEIDGDVYVTNYSADIGKMIKVCITPAYEYDLSGEAIL